MKRGSPADRHSYPENIVANGNKQFCNEKENDYNPVMQNSVQCLHANLQNISSGQ